MTTARRILLLAVSSGCATALLGCSDEEPAPVTPSQDEFTYLFRDGTTASGLASFEQVCGSADKPFIVETIGGGVALLDYDNDGDLDAYLTNGSRFAQDPKTAPRDALYRNDGSGRFSDATDEAGLGDTAWTGGVRVVDFDADGWSDLYITNYGPNVLYRNRGDGTFEDVTARAGVGDPAWSTGACFLDFDRDGDLDLYVANYVDVDEEKMLREREHVTYRGVTVMKGPRGLPEAYDSFYVNEGDGVFRDASVELGVRTSKQFGFQCVAFDVDKDGWVDIYVANDSVDNFLWHNDAGKGFTDTAFLSGLALSMGGKPQAGMGVGIGDYDFDLEPDVFVTNFADDYFTMYRGSGDGRFLDVTNRLRLTRVTHSFLGWGCGFLDADSDGDVEIFMVNGHVYPQVDGFNLGTPYHQRSLLFEYDGDAFREPIGGGGPGFEIAAASRGAATGDIDGDGDIDILIGNIDGPPTLLVNESAQRDDNRWLKVRVVGAGGNRDAVGARVVVQVGEREHLRLSATGGSFLSSSDPRMHIGLGAAERADRVSVTWPDGTKDVVSDVPAGSIVTIEQGANDDGTARVDTRPYLSHAR